MTTRLDARPPDLGALFRPGDPLTVVLTWPTGTLTGRTFTSSLGAASLGLAVVGDVMTITATPAQTTAAAAVEAWELIETTAADDVTLIVGQWVATETATGHQDVAVTVSAATGDVDVNLQGMSAVGELTIAGDLAIGGDVTVAGQPLTFLVADDPAEVDLATVGDVTTLSLTDLVARRAFVYKTGEYYWSSYGVASAQTLTQDQLVLIPVLLREGTVDRIGLEVTTLQAGSSIRLGVYTDDNGLPANLIAESTAAADSTSNGVKDQTISADIPVNGVYWLAACAQGAAGVAILGCDSSLSPVPVPLGTSAVGGTAVKCSRIKASVTGALPATITGLNANAQASRVRWHFRYA